MAIAPRLKWYLDTRGVSYEVLPHPRSSTSAEAAQRARVPARNLAKAVLLEDERGYVMAIVPASHRVELHSVGDGLHRALELATERELGSLFGDCDRGAMPPLGEPYHIPTVYDDALAGLSEVWFEAGDHEDLVHMTGEEFLRLLEGSLHGRFSRPA
jgi:Ala-tRNA(Pro) deacylase